MLPHYSPLKVAENFSMLNGLFPGRIDLGLGRAPGTSARVAHALQRDRRQPPPDDFREQMDELLGYLGKDGPEVTLLGSSPQSAIWAAEMGLPYVFADFINPQGAPLALYYREHFRASAWLKEPRVGVAVWAICAETGDEAFRLSLSARMMLLSLFRGELIAVPSVDKAAAFLEREGGDPQDLPAGRRMLTRTRDRVLKELKDVADSYSADEVFVVNIVHDHRARMKSYELLATNEHE